VTYEQLVAKLKDRLWTVGLEQRYRTELRCRRRKEGESIRELAQGLHRLMLRAYPGESDSKLGQHIATDAFITALADPEMQVKIRDRDRDTMEEAVKAALRYESNRAAAESSLGSSRQRSVRSVEDQPLESRPAEVEDAAAPRRAQADHSRQSDGDPRHKRHGETSSTYHSSPRNRDRRVRAASQPDNSQLEEVMKRLQQVESDRQKEQAEMATLRRRLEQYEWSAQSRPRDQPPAPQRPPTPRQEYPPRSQPSQQYLPQESVRQSSAPSLVQPATVICWSCGEPGHYSRQCPSSRRYQQPAEQSDQRQTDPNRSRRPA